MTCYLAEEYWMLYFPLCEMYRDILSSASLQTNSLKNHKEGKFQLSPSEEIIWVKHYLHNLFFSKPSLQKDEYFSKTESQTNFNFLKLCKNECQPVFVRPLQKNIIMKSFDYVTEISLRNGLICLKSRQVDHGQLQLILSKIFVT